MMEKFIATAIIVAFIGPLFWLGVGYLENKLKSLTYKAVALWRSKQTPTQSRLFKYASRAWAIGQKRIL